MKKLKYLLVIPLMLLFSTGCSYKELNDIAIASSLGIDYENNKYTITAEVLNLNKKDEGDVTGGSILYYGEGKTIAEAIRNIYFRYPKLLHLGHLRLIVLGKNTIEEKTDEIFDYFLRSPEAAKDPYILVNNKGSAKEIINPEEKNEETFNAKELISNLESNQLRQGTVTMINLEEFLSAYLRDGIDPIIPTINMDKEKDNKYSTTTINGMTPFKNNALLTPLSIEESRAYSMLNNSFTDIMIVTKYQNKDLSALLVFPNSDYEVKMKNNKINVNINLKFEGHISEVQQKIDLINENNLKEIKINLTETIEEKVRKLLQYCKKNNVDLLGLKDQIYRHYYKEYKNYKDENIYSIATFNIKTDITLDRHGSTYIGSTKGGIYDKN